MKRLITAIREAVRWKVTPDAYSYSGQIERLEATVENQGNLIAELIEQLHGRALDTKTIEEMLSSYDVEVDFSK